MSRIEAEKELAEKIEAYRNSIIHADEPSLAERVWLPGPDVSLIHPRGRESGWEQIRENFYGRIMAGLFSTRELVLAGALSFWVYEGAAVAEFDWRFTAVLKENGQIHRTSGRESQVFVKVPELGWRLAHVHYSALP